MCRAPIAGLIVFVLASFAVRAGTGAVIRQIVDAH